ncbi:LytR/AlgR family response regulator transcription factor [Streptomyces sp. NPDC091385]|uniref:LytR/AlgR family response regulator transcription factor n=1 Tax=Streptomyces sp. NPDC091385 TaxID=3365997 RepID=UPI00381E539B
MSSTERARRTDTTTARLTANAAPLRVLAVDDEEPALEELLYLLGEDPRVGDVLPALDATEALRLLGRAVETGSDGTGAIDVVFLDIHMPGLSGLELARLLGGFAAPPLIVFVTAHEDFALRAFDLKAVDYLLKPLRAERFAEAVRRVAELTRAGQGPRAAAPTAPPGAGSDQVPVELGGVTRFVPVADIVHAEAQGDYARLHTPYGSHLVRIPLATLEEQWRPHGFVRIHRSHLVALARIEELRLDGGNLTVRVGDRVLAVSRRNARELRDLLARRATRAADRPR